MPGWVIAAILTIFALAFIALSVATVLSFLRASRAGRVRVQATVVGHARRAAIEIGDPDSYAPVYRFTAADGRSHEVEDRWSSTPARYSVGQRIEVEYPHGQPQRAAPPRQAVRALSAVLLGLAAMLFSVVAAFAWTMVLL